MSAHTGHHHHHGHGHHHGNGANLGRILKISTIGTLALVALGLVAGYYSHSLALISEAWHNLSDALALVLSWLAVWLQSRPANATKTFGYHRAGVLAAFVNAVTLVGISLYIFYDSYQRFLHPTVVDTQVMSAVAFVGIVLNAGIAVALYKSSKDDVNIRSTFTHMAGDTLGSVGVLLGAGLIRVTGIQAIDPALSVLISGLILWTSWDIIHETLNILLEGLPRQLTLDEVTAEMRCVTGVIDVHDLHVWTLGPQMVALSCHIRIADIPPSESGEILQCVNQRLQERFQIGHTTIQFEHETCVEPCRATIC